MNHSQEGNGNSQQARILGNNLNSGIQRAQRNQLNPNKYAGQKHKIQERKEEQYHQDGALEHRHPKRANELKEATSNERNNLQHSNNRFRMPGLKMFAKSSASGHQPQPVPSCYNLSSSNQSRNRGTRTSGQKPRKNLGFIRPSNEQRTINSNKRVCKEVEKEQERDHDE